MTTERAHDSRRRISSTLNGERVQKGFLLALVVVISVLFLTMIRSFLAGLVLAAVFAGMSRPAYLDLERGIGGRRRIAAMLTVLGLVLLVLVPVAAFLALVVSQAVEVGDAAGPWIEEQFGRWDELAAAAERLPFVGQFMPEQAELATRVSESFGRVGSFMISSVRAATTGTLNVFLQLFVMIYAMYFFLLDGPRMLARMFYFVPLTESDERRLVDQFVSVTRATIKGSILVGLLQGALAGAAFFVLGLPGAAFWATVMAVLSVIPILGSGLVWGPAAIILAATGRVGAGIALTVWGLLIVGMVDNFLRPRLVGRDTKMSDLLVLLSTFGGLAMFGLLGFIIGPIVAALFVTVWDLYGTAFEDVLPNDHPVVEPGS